MWSGVATVTASICLSILSSITRKSRKRGTVGNSLYVFAAMVSSTSQNAANSTCGEFLKAEITASPLPPTPTTATLSLEFGPGVLAMLQDGRTIRPPATAAPFKKFLRFNIFFPFIYCIVFVKIEAGSPPRQRYKKKDAPPRSVIYECRPLWFDIKV